MVNLPRREFLMLAKTYQPKKMTVGGWYVSEKLDGTRVFWDGGISRDLPTIEVPWANVVNPKTGRMKRRIRPEATGLWTMYGNPINAPDWFLNLLPCMPLDGKLWAGYGNLQLCRSLCSGGGSDTDWKEVEFAAFSTPPIEKMFEDGEIRNANMKLKLTKLNFDLWLHRYDQGILDDWFHLSTKSGKVTFDIELAVLRDAIPSEGNVYLLQQKRLPYGVKEAAQAVEDELDRVLTKGGNGLIIRDPDSVWEPHRVDTVLKYAKRGT